MMIQPDQEISIPKIEEESTKSNVGWTIGGFTGIAMILGALLYKGLVRDGLPHSSLMFIGVPLLLAVVLALSPSPKSATGSILKGMALALLIVAPLVGEGYLCILMASPLFLVVGLIVGLVADSLKKAEKRNKVICVAALIFPFTLEGVVPRLTHPRSQVVEATQVIKAPVRDVRDALAQSPDITNPLPRFLSIGFPKPIKVRGHGLAINDRRVIHFTGAEGDPEGDLAMQVTESRPGYVRFETIGDTSKLTQWIYWRNSEVTYTAIDATHTKVTWRIRFDRQLDPFWYFGPWERFAVRDAAQYLIRANATPKESTQG
jgi:hypothetical protein